MIQILYMAIVWDLPALFCTRKSKLSSLQVSRILIAEKNSSFEQLITAARNYISMYRPGVSLAVEALNGLVQCAPLTSSMTSLVSHRMRTILGSYNIHMATET
jgi:hypothetical protein